MTPPVYFALRGRLDLLRSPRETLTAASGGLVSLVAYGIAIVAMSLGPMGPVSALRETSVVFAAMIGRVFLHERLTAFRIVACMVVALGAICLGHSGGHSIRKSGAPSRLLAPVMSPLRR